MDFRINKGIGKPVEVGGLQAQYIFIFCIGLVGIFFLFVILFMAGVSQVICIAIGVTAALLLGKITFSLSRKYGRWGLMKLQARRSLPCFVIRRLPVYKLLRHKA